MKSSLRFAAAGLTAVSLWSAVSCTRSTLDSLAGPSGDEQLPRAAFTLSSCRDCVIADTYTTLIKAFADPDSASNLPEIATTQIAGHAGDSVVVHLKADDSLVAALPAAQALIITGAGADSLSLATLVTPRTVYRFQSDAIITLRYRLNRALARVPSGAFRLVQSTSARVESFSATDVASQSIDGRTADLTVDPACTTLMAVNANGQYCGVTIQFTPFNLAAAFQAQGARFQSATGTGAAKPMDISFSAPVAEVEFTFYDPTFAGNTFEARDATGGQIKFVAIPGNGVPGLFTKQIASAQGAISSIHIGAAAGDYLDYSMRVKFQQPGCYISNFTSYGQAQSEWGDATYGHTAKNIRQIGSAMTSIAMGLSVFQAPVTPLALNDLGNANGGFGSAGNVIWETLVSVPSTNALVYDPLTSIDDVRNAVCKGRAVVMGVNVDGKGKPHHFVLVTGVNADSTLQIQDPKGSSSSRPLSDYAPPYQVRGAIRKSSDEPVPQYFAIYAPGRIEVSDASGAHTIVDDTTAVAGIVGSAVGRDALDDDDAPFAVDSIGQSFVRLPLGGSYSIVIPRPHSDSSHVTMLAATLGGVVTPYSQTLNGSEQPWAFDVTTSASGAVVVPTVAGYVNINRSCGQSHTVTNSNGLPLDLTYGVEGSTETGSVHIEAASSTQLRTKSKGRLLLYQNGQLVYSADAPSGCASDGDHDGDATSHHQGHDGHDGDKAHGGDRGHDGDKGHRGSKGHDGNKGRDRDKGHDGNKGHDGDKGHDREKGHDGGKGHDGHK